MARLAVPGLPHPVTQRGNRRLNVFFSDDDCQLYLGLLSERCRKAGVEIWSYRLMPNHLHIILMPLTPQGLGLALGETHRRYSGVINARLRVTRDGGAIRFLSPQFRDGRALRGSQCFRTGWGNTEILYKAKF